MLDTKWKRLAAHDRANKYGLSQADFYQPFAYGQKYLAGKGELVLIYPRWVEFSAPLSAFGYDSDLRLWALPFDLEQDQLLGAELLSLPLRELAYCNAIWKQEQV